ncbi:histidine triad nucleotide-binding protein [Clostridiaceae bacterium HSG29]|nr:histidine triad nucleotide-binding protein [Clostridiaceae bacterium HSG29]
MSDCIFCKIANGDIPSTKVYENEYVYAFRDLEPVAPTHVLIIPKEHIQSLNYMDESNVELLGKLMLAAKEIARLEGLAEDGYRVINNNGLMGGQTVNHFHLHLVGGRSMQWPPG